MSIRFLRRTWKKNACKAIIPVLTVSPQKQIYICFHILTNGIKVCFQKLLKFKKHNNNYGDLANLTSLIGNIYVASAETGDDYIYNISRPTTKKQFPFLFSQERKNMVQLFSP